MKVDCPMYCSVNASASARAIYIDIVDLYVDSSTAKMGGEYVAGALLHRDCVWSLCNLNKETNDMVSYS
jgi:hypothetical protein